MLEERFIVFDVPEDAPVLGKLFDQAGATA